MRDPLTAADTSPVRPPLALRQTEAAREIGMCVRKLRNLTKRGIVPHIMVGRTPLYPWLELQQWLSKQVGRLP